MTIGVKRLKDCTFGGMGWEFWPTFLWPRERRRHAACHFSGAARFLLDIFARLCTCYGQALDCKGCGSSPIPVSPQAASIWSKCRQQAERDKNTVPACASGAVGQHCFTTTSHITACHLIQEVFLDIKQGRVDLQALRSSTGASSALAAPVPWPNGIRPIPGDLMLAAPEHLHLMVTGILTCFNEMKLPANERAGHQCWKRTVSVLAVVPRLMNKKQLFPRRRQMRQPWPFCFNASKKKMKSR